MVTSAWLDAEGCLLVQGDAQKPAVQEEWISKAAAEKQAVKPSQPGFQGLRYRWYPGKEQGTKLSAAQVLSDSEIEAIELGGAGP